jgi:hypothetical protein
MERERKSDNRYDYPEEAARRILKRAAEIDALRAVNMSVADLRAAARDAGISEEAIDKALAEERLRVDGSTEFGQSPAPSRLKIWIQGAFAAVVGFATGAITGGSAESGVFADPNPETNVGVLVLSFLCFAVALRSTGKKAQRRFQIINLAIWTAFLIGWSLVHGDFFEDVVSLSLTCLFLSASGGGFVIATRERYARRKAAAAKRAIVRQHTS